MNRRTLKPLGANISGVGGCKAINPKNLSTEDRLALLEEQVCYMSQAISAFTNKTEEEQPQNVNKDGIPIGTVAIGETEKAAFKFYLTVLEDGYQVGVNTYHSLSAAAEAASKVRRSGWTFWKLMDGRTLKEAYK